MIPQRNAVRCNSRDDRSNSRIRSMQFTKPQVSIHLLRDGEPIPYERWYAPNGARYVPNGVRYALTGVGIGKNTLNYKTFPEKVIKEYFYNLTIWKKVGRIVLNYRGDDGIENRKACFQRVGDGCKPIPFAKNSSSRSHRENGSFAY